jgi:uncharacterized membrane protein
VVVFSGVISAVGLIELDRSGNVPQDLLENWIYDGGATGARSLLAAIASSTIDRLLDHNTALSLAAGQMGPRLLRNFTRDRGNQLTRCISRNVLLCIDGIAKRSDRK